MAILSFSKTSEQLLAGLKVRTSRIWKPSHTANWQRWYDNGRLFHHAYDKSPRNGGKKIGDIYLDGRPTQQYLWQMTDLDLIAEGGMCQTKEEFYQLVGHGPEQLVTVLWFFFKPLYLSRGEVDVVNLDKWYGWDGTAVISITQKPFIVDGSDFYKWFVQEVRGDNGS